MNRQTPAKPRSFASSTSPSLSNLRRHLEWAVVLLIGIYIGLNVARVTEYWGASSVQKKMPLSDHLQQHKVHNDVFLGNLDSRKLPMTIMRNTSSLEVEHCQQSMDEARKRNERLQAELGQLKASNKADGEGTATVGTPPPQNTSSLEIKHLKQAISEASKRNERLQAELGQLKASYKADGEGTATVGTPHPTTSSSNDASLAVNAHPICQKFLPHPVPTAASLWHSYLEHVLYASCLPNDIRFRFHDFTTELLQMISPRLPRSVKSLPQGRQWRSFEHVLDVLYSRYQYIQRVKQNGGHSSAAKMPPPPRPLKILVMGGSLLVGTNCRMLFTELQLGKFMGLPRRDCTWANRLDKFLNAFQTAIFTIPHISANNSSNSFSGGALKQPDIPLFQVTKVAMGGTNTETGSVIWKYDLVPPEARHPDIVINAYSTNDMHILTILEAQSSNITLRDRIFDMTQDFVRNVMDGDNSCDDDDAKQKGETNRPPLILYMDDYLGNEQRKIWETTELSQSVQVLASYYGFASASFADVIRDMVYGDTKESWLSSDWWKGGSFQREIHPGMGMHIASAWVAAYNLLNILTTYCSLPQPESHSIAEYEPHLLGLSSLRNNVNKAKGQPNPVPKGLPPRLTQDLLLEDVSSLWKQAEADQKERCTTIDPNAWNSQGGKGKLRCPFSWVSGLSLQQNNETFVEEYFKNQASTWNGWTLSSDGGKAGFIPTQAAGMKDNNMDLDFTFEQPIKTITIFWMKSYGTKWADSKFNLKLLQHEKSGNFVELQHRELLGFHHKNTSEMYNEEIELNDPIPPTTKFRFSSKLVSGSSFKLMGLAICS